MKKVILCALMALSALRTYPAESGNKIRAQQLVDQLTRDHLDLITVGIHARPPQSGDYIIIAHTMAVSIGHKSEGADLVTLESGRPDGPNPLQGWIYDVGLPLRDPHGTIFAFVAFHVKPDPKGADPRGAALKLAEKYRDELSALAPTPAALFGPAR